MFSGIVEGLRPVVALGDQPGARTLAIDLGSFAEGVGVGDSICVTGCCLTVSEMEGSVVTFHVMGETLGLTRFGSLKQGSLVNIERSLKLADLLGGHLVSGHLDGLGTVVRVEELEGQTDLTVEVPEHLQDLVVHKGSIAIDGVSLTIAKLDQREVTVCLIPHTLEITTLGRLAVGDQVHLEMDMIGKWVKQLIQPHLP